MKNLKLFILILVSILIAVGSYFGYSYFAQANQKDIVAAHHHFRMQLIIEGQYIDLSQDEFQEDYEKGSCSAELPKTPIHLHDGVDQIVHIHWDKIKGGQVLKYYGLNLIDKNNEILEYQPSKDIKLNKVEIKGDLIPSPNETSTFWVYTGKKDEYKKRDLQDFLVQDLETFFDKKSTLTQQREELKEINYNLFKSIKADADSGKHSEGELEEIQNLIGNVVIFVQENEPTDQEIRDRFNQLTPLGDSVCGG